jgi:hypothetical protein
MIRRFISILVAAAPIALASQAQALPTLTYQTVTQSAPPNSGDLMTINCPAGTKVLSGGWETNSANGPYVMVWVSRQVGNGWRVMMVNQHPSASIGFTGYAICASGVPGLATSTTSIGPVNVPGKSGKAQAVPCSNGLPTGGGFDSNFPNPSLLIPHASYPGPTNVWTSSEYNSSNVDKTFTAFVTCATGLPGTVTPVQGGTVNFAPGASSVLNIDCNQGDLAVGGGYYTLASGSLSSTVQLVRTVRNRPDTGNSRRWTVRAYNANAFAQAQIIPFVQCLH